MAQFWEYVKMALSNIRANKGRSVLTMLGIIIGIASVIMILSIGNGVQNTVNDELNSMAGGQVAIYVNDDAQEEYYITDGDMEAIRERVDHVKGVTDTWTISGTILAPKGDFETYVSCGTWDMQYANQTEMKRGKYFTREDFYAGNKVGVISDQDAIRLFGTDDVVGMTVEVTLYNITQEVTLIGVCESQSSALDMSYVMEMPVYIYSPYTMLESYDVSVGDTYSVVIICEDSAYSRQVIEDTVRLLEARHQCQGQDIYVTEDFNDYLDQINEVLGVVTIFIVFVAAISLLVGGIGVMNIMLVSVTERTREIGIRKALGARTGSILLQFLSESAIITLLGGIIGIILGVSGAVAICSLPALGVAPGIQLSTILLASLFSSAVGIFFGIYPARKAAKMHPIDALRQNG